MTSGDERTLRELQERVWELNKERGFNLTDPDKKLVILMEEVGELAKAVRKQVGLGFSDTTQTRDVAEELADVQIVLLGLARMLDVDMADVVEQKIAENEKRTWS